MGTFRDADDLAAWEKLGDETRMARAAASTQRKTKTSSKPNSKRSRGSRVCKPFDAETMRQIERAAAEVLRDEKLKRRGQ